MIQTNREMLIHQVPLKAKSIEYDPRRTLACQMARRYRLSRSQPPQTLQVHSGGTQHALLVEAQQKVDECRGVEAQEVLSLNAKRDRLWSMRLRGCWM